MLLFFNKRSTQHGLIRNAQVCAVNLSSPSPISDIVKIWTLAYRNQENYSMGQFILKSLFINAPTCGTKKTSGNRCDTTLPG